MELRQLEYLVTVAQEGSFTRAARRLLVSQPGVSAQVRRLERELGQALLDRSERSVRLTAVGEAVLPYARAALAAVDGARLAVSEMTGLLRGRAAIGTVTSHATDLPAMLAVFSARHPQVEITLSEDDSASLIAGLRAGRLDGAIVGVGAATPGGLEAQVIADEAIVAAVGVQHELAGRDVVALSELAGRALISLPRGTGLRARLDEACAAAGFVPRIAFEASAPEVLADLAAHGLGIALLPRTFAAWRADRLKAVAIDPPRMRGRLVFAWRAGEPGSPAGRALVSHVRQALAAQRPAGKARRATMPEERRHESADLEDYEVLDGSDTLAGDPGDDPLDRGVVPPERWSAGVRYGTTGEELADGETLEQLLAEEEADTVTRLELDGDGPEAGTDLDENEPEDDIGRSLDDDQGPDPRAGRLAEAGDTDYLQSQDRVARDVGPDGGGASAEEAALHVREPGEGEA